MDKRVATAIYLVVMIGVIVAVDLLFLRGSTETPVRLIVNIALVAAFLAGYMLLFRRRR